MDNPVWFILGLIILGHVFFISMLIYMFYEIELLTPYQRFVITSKRADLDKAWASFILMLRLRKYFLALTSGLFKLWLSYVTWKKANYIGYIDVLALQIIAGILMIIFTKNLVYDAFFQIIWPCLKYYVTKQPG